MELYRRVDEVLHYLWDPIGLAGAPEARDEYQGYRPKVFALVQAGVAKETIADYLLGVERERMELTPKPGRALEVAEMLLAHREWIFG